MRKVLKWREGNPTLFILICILMRTWQGRSAYVLSWVWAYARFLSLYTHPRIGDFTADPCLSRFLHPNDLCPQERSKVNFLMVEGTGSEEKPLKIPKEVWILVNHLYTKACDQVRFSSSSPGRKMMDVQFFYTSEHAGGLVPDTRPTGGDAEHHWLSGHQHPRHHLYPFLVLMVLTWI